MAVSTPAKRGFTRPLIIALVAIAIVAVLGYSYASPYLALDRLKRAADARDVATVNEYVDYPALRESLKEEIAGLLTRRVHASGNPFAAIGAMIGAALIGPMVDAYATPDGVAALLNGMPPRGNPTDRPPASRGAPAARTRHRGRRRTGRLEPHGRRHAAPRPSRGNCTKPGGHDDCVRP